MPRRGPIAWFVAAAGIGGVALLATLGGGTQTAPSILVAKAAVPAGMVIREPNLVTLFELRAVAGAQVLRGLILRPEDLVGRRVSAIIVAGEPITQASLGGPIGEPGPLRADERAVAVPTGAAGSSSAALIPGDHVDVVTSNVSEGPLGAAQVVASNVEVLSVSASEVDQGQSDALLRIPARQALKVASALSTARDVRLIRRAAAVTQVP